MAIGGEARYQSYMGKKYRKGEVILMASYPKPFMTITELIQMGKTRCSIENDIHSVYGKKFARRRGAGRGKWEIDTEAYAKYEQKLRDLQA